MRGLPRIGREREIRDETHDVAWAATRREDFREGGAREGVSFDTEHLAADGFEGFFSAMSDDEADARNGRRSMLERLGEGNDGRRIRPVLRKPRRAPRRTERTRVVGR